MKDPMLGVCLRARLLEGDSRLVQVIDLHAYEAFKGQKNGLAQKASDDPKKPYKP